MKKPLRNAQGRYKKAGIKELIERGKQIADRGRQLFCIAYFITIPLCIWLQPYYDQYIAPVYYFKAETVQAQEIEHVEKEEKEKEVMWTTESIEQKIRNTFPLTPNTAVAVAKAESGIHLLATAYNPEWHYDRYGNPVCKGSYGVMQIACVHHLESPEALFDVEFNLQKAKEIYTEQGWQPWGGYTSGGWRNHL